MLNKGQRIYETGCGAQLPQFLGHIWTLVWLGIGVAVLEAAIAALLLALRRDVLDELPPLALPTETDMRKMGLDTTAINVLATGKYLPALFC